MESCLEFFLYGFELWNILVQVYNLNLYFIGVKDLNDDVLKIIICGLFLFVDDSVVIEFLEKFNVFLKSEIKYEKIRYFVIYCMISVFNGNRFLYV